MTRFLSTSLALFVAASICAAHEVRLEQSERPLDTIMAPPLGNSVEIAKIVECQNRIQKIGATAENLERLARAYITAARATLDDRFHALALLTAETLEAQHGESANSLFLRGHALHNLHRFQEAEAVARKLIKVRGRPADHGLLSDALMEQGLIGEATEACQRFVDLEPGLESFARASHLRWLNGDLDDAAEMMFEAVRAGSPKDPEPLAWALTRLSNLQLQLGRHDISLALANAALQLKQDYPPALLGQGRALLQLDRIRDSISPLDRAAERCPLPEYQWWLAEALRANGLAERANQIEFHLIQHGFETDPRTVSIFLTTRGVASRQALALATEEMESRPDAVTKDTLAYALLAAGKLQEARDLSIDALNTGIRDARVFLHAGLIAAANGFAAEAEDHFAAASGMAATLTPSERRQLENNLQADTA